MVLECVCVQFERSEWELHIQSVLEEKCRSFVSRFVLLSHAVTQGGKKPQGSIRNGIYRCPPQCQSGEGSTSLP